MRQRHFHTLAFLLVLAGALLAARLAYERVSPIELPRVAALESVPDALAGLDLGALLPQPNPQARPTATPEPTVLAAAGPQEPSPSPPSEQPAEADSAAEVSTAASAPVEPTATPSEPPAATEAATARPTATFAPATPTPTSTPEQLSGPAFPFTAVAAVRHSSGDCPGASIRGMVRDVGGNPLPGVRIWRYDQWGNEQTVETKSGEIDLGQYDFPLGDTPNVHYVQVVDASGAPVSAAIEIAHRQGEHADATCHWLDWSRSF